MNTVDDNNFNDVYGLDNLDGYDYSDPGYRQRIPRPRPRFPYYFLPFFFIRPIRPYYPPYYPYYPRPYYPRPYYPRPYYPPYMFPYYDDDYDYDYDDDDDDD